MGLSCQKKAKFIYRKRIGIADEKTSTIIDGSTTTAWYQPRDKKIPADIVIDLGKAENLSGFKYLPGQGRSNGIITKYEFYISDDNNQWKLVSDGEFSNIQNNPLWQIKRFTAAKARYIKLRALGNTQNNDAVGYSEVDVITD